MDPLIWRNTVIDQKRETEWRCVTHHLTNYSIPRGVSGPSYLEEYGNRSEERDRMEVCYAPID